MSDDFKEEVIATGGNAERGFSSGRGPIDEEFDEGGSIRVADRVEDERLESRGDGRALPESTEKLLDAIEARHEEERAAREPQYAAEGETVETVDGNGEESADPAPAAGEPTTKTPPTEDVIAPLKAENERLDAANKALIAELEAARSAKPDLPALHKMLSEAGEGYIEDQVGAVRRLIAAGLGIDDLTDKRVDDEIRDLYTDLTGFVLGVTPEDKHLAKRDAARARHLVAREKRERTAEKQSAEQKAKADAEASKADQAAAFIGNRISTKRDDGRSLADDHPLLMQFAQKLEGHRPEALIWRTISEEIQTGRLDAKSGDDQLIAQAAKIIETRYQTLADEFGKTTKPSTATPAPKQAATETARNDQRQSSHGARTITTADRSVAPATPPAKKPEQKQERPKFKTKAEAQAWALRHLSD